MTTDQARKRLDYLINDCSKGNPHFHQWVDADRELFAYLKEVLGRTEKMPQDKSPPFPEKKAGGHVMGNH